MENIIEIKGLVKRYDDKVAIDGLDLTVRTGEIFGFLGPNGAGKTTTVRVMSTLADFDCGTVYICGHDIKKDPSKAKACIGMIQQRISLDKDLTIRENMILYSLYHKISSAERRRRIDALSEYIGLTEYMDNMVDTLSGGWKKRAAIVCALIHEPKILFLDEPTVGLDTQARRLLWDIIRRLNNDGTTIFLTTHYIEEAEALCDRVGIINRGKLIDIGPPEDLCSRVGATAVEYFHNGVKTQYRYFQNREEANEFVSTLPEGTTVTVRRTNLEDSFVELTGESVGRVR
ncbi:MAG: ABC transporter ATP-binding protein [Euryarchaeota archaeon]|nr:ABC transporter ATP-binding protein [Euryarchaeota archaeon]